MAGAVLEVRKIFGYAKNSNKSNWKKNIAGSNVEHGTLSSVVWLFKHWGSALVCKIGGPPGLNLATQESMHQRLS